MWVFPLVSFPTARYRIVTLEELLYAFFHFPIAVAAPFVGWYFFVLSEGDIWGAGLLISLPYILMIFSTSLFGWLSDRWGSKRVIVMSNIIMAGSYFFYWIIESAELFFWSYLAFNFFIAAFNPAFNRLMTLKSPEEERGKMFGRLGVMASFGFLLGSLFTSLTIDSLGLQSLFLGAGIISCLGVLLGLRLQEVDPSAVDAKPSLRSPLFKQKNQASLSLIYLLLVLTIFSQVTTSLVAGLYSIFIDQELGLSVSWVAIVNTLATLFGMGGTYVMGRMVNRVKPRPLVILAMILYFLLAFGTHILSSINPFLMLAMYTIPIYSVFFILSPLLIAENTTEENRGRYMGFLGASNYIGIAAGTLIGAYFASETGKIRPNFGIGSLVGFIGIVIAFLFFKMPSTTERDVEVPPFPN